MSYFRRILGERGRKLGGGARDWRAWIQIMSSLDMDQGGLLKCDAGYHCLD
jgi:hypothetical protein